MRSAPSILPQEVSDNREERLNQLVQAQGTLRDAKDAGRGRDVQLAVRHAVELVHSGKLGTIEKVNAILRVVSAIIPDNQVSIGIYVSNQYTV